MRILSPGQKTEYNRRWQEKHPEKRAAHKAVEWALKRGALCVMACAVCGSDDAQAHHEDYSKPLSVVWLCSKHHAARHREINDNAVLSVVPIQAFRDADAMAETARTAPRGAGGPKGLTDDILTDILLHPASAQRTAEIFGISRTMVQGIRNGKYHPHIRASIERS